MQVKLLNHQTIPGLAPGSSWHNYGAKREGWNTIQSAPESEPQTATANPEQIELI